MTNEKLMQAAKKSRQKSYSPYSRFSVGAALLTNGGKVYTGANIENFKIILQNKNEIKEFTLGELLPYSFKLKEDEKNEND